MQQIWCSLVILLHILRTPFPTNTSGWLLLNLRYLSFDGKYIIFLVVFDNFSSVLQELPRGLIFNALIYESKYPNLASRSSLRNYGKLLRKHLRIITFQIAFLLCYITCWKSSRFVKINNSKKLKIAICWKKDYLEVIY